MTIQDTIPIPVAGTQELLTKYSKRKTFYVSVFKRPFGGQLHFAIMDTMRNQEMRNVKYYFRIKLKPKK